MKLKIKLHFVENNSYDDKIPIAGLPVGLMGSPHNYISQSSHDDNIPVAGLP
jgi:hypothetical protein